MKNLFMVLVLVLFVGIAQSNVAYDTRHSTDAYSVHYLLTGSGFYSSDFNVGIEYVDDFGMCYFVAWLDDYYSGSDADAQRMAAAILAVALVSRETSWTSGAVCVGFTNKLFIMTTADARYLQSNIGYMSENEIINYMAGHMVILDQ